MLLFLLLVSAYMGLRQMALSWLRIKRRMRMQALLTIKMLFRCVDLMR